MEKPAIFGLFADDHASLPNHTLKWNAMSDRNPQIPIVQGIMS